MSHPVKPAPPRDERGGSTIRVVAMRTGLGLETLRAWERRYGFPSPDRRAGSNRRLYREADVERLLAIRRALDSGYRVGDVIDKTGPELMALAGLEVGRPPKPVLPSPDAGPAVEELLGLLERDAIGDLEQELRRGAAALGPRRFVTELAHPFAVRVGDAWASGRINVRHEHMATECLVTQLRQMLATFQDNQGRPLVLLATLPGEPHTLSLQMVALFLVTLGAKPRLLGAATPAAELVESARILHADVVGVAVTPSSDLRKARADIRVLQRELPRSVGLWIGGSAAPSLRVESELTRVLTTWESIAEAVVEQRRRPRRTGDRAWRGA